MIESTENKEVLVVGATGIVGSRVAIGLAAQGHRVRALTRPSSDVSALKAAGVTCVPGDLKEPEGLVKVCEGVDVVVTTANSAARQPPDTVEAVDLAGTRALIDAANKAGVSQFVYVSAHAASRDVPVPFIQAKAAMEAHVESSGLAYTIIRPDFFTEAWIGMLAAMPAAEGQPVTFIGNGDRRHNFVSAQDVAAVILACVGNPAAQNRGFDVGGPENLSWREAVTRFGKATGQEFPVEDLGADGTLPHLPPEVSDLIRHYDRDRRIDTTTVTRELGVSLTPVDVTLKRMVAGHE